MVIGKVEFRSDHFLKRKSKEYHSLLDLDSVNDLQVKTTKKTIKFQRQNGFSYLNGLSIDVSFSRFNMNNNFRMIFKKQKSFEKKNN